MKNPIKALAITNTVLLVGLILFLVFAGGKTESGEKVNFFSKRDDDRDEAAE
jgi:hypothetical protein